MAIMQHQGLSCHCTAIMNVRPDHMCNLVEILVALETAMKNCW